MTEAFMNVSKALLFLQFYFSGVQCLDIPGTSAEL